MTTAGRPVVIVGGGAAGYFAAIRCAELNPSQPVILLEGTQRPLTKVRISGGGRCNVTHHCFDPSVFVKNYPRGHRELLGAFSRFQARDTVAWFAARGVRLKAEADGRMFPVTDSSQTIIDCLQDAARRAGVTIRLGAIVRSLTPEPEGAGFRLELKKGELLSAARVLLATGSSPMGYQFAQSVGHTIEPLVPSLFTFKMTDTRLADLAGVAVEDVHLRLVVSDKKKRYQHRGPLLVTHWGVSGPAVLKLSAWGAVELCQDEYRARLVVNFLPALTTDEVTSRLLDYKSEHPKRGIGNHQLFEQIPRRLWHKLIEAAGLGVQQPWGEAPNKALARLADELSRAEYAIVGKGEFKDEFVTCGGVRRKEVDFRTMESRVVPGLYFAGEILDVDGITGGFNFQNAWTTGFIAGSHMAEALPAT